LGFLAIALRHLDHALRSTAQIQALDDPTIAYLQPQNIIFVSSSAASRGRSIAKDRKEPLKS
jgi:hypothetical protein